MGPGDSKVLRAGHCHRSLLIGFICACAVLCVYADEENEVASANSDGRSAMQDRSDGAPRRSGAGAGEKEEQIKLTRFTSVPKLSKVVEKKINYASFDGGAKVAASSSEIRGARKLLSDSKDAYMMAPCNARNWFVIELSEQILPVIFTLCSHEYYSSSVRDFQILGSKSFPTGVWEVLGSYRAKNERGCQNFAVHNSAWSRYIKFRWISEYGSEYYCTLTTLRVFGATMLEDYTADVHGRNSVFNDWLSEDAEILDGIENRTSAQPLPSLLTLPRRSLMTTVDVVRSGLSHAASIVRSALTILRDAPPAEETGSRSSLVYLIQDEDEDTPEVEIPTTSIKTDNVSSAANETIEERRKEEPTDGHVNTTENAVAPPPPSAHSASATAASGETTGPVPTAGMTENDISISAPDGNDEKESAGDSQRLDSPPGAKVDDVPKNESSHLSEASQQDTPTPAQGSTAGSTGAPDNEIAQAERVAVSGDASVETNAHQNVERGTQDAAPPGDAASHQLAGAEPAKPAAGEVLSVPPSSASDAPGPPPLSAVPPASSQSSKGSSTKNVDKSRDSVFKYLSKSLKSIQSQQEELQSHIAGLHTDVRQRSTQSHTSIMRLRTDLRAAKLELDSMKHKMEWMEIGMATLGMILVCIVPTMLWLSQRRQTPEATAPAIAPLSSDSKCAHAQPPVPQSNTEMRGQGDDGIVACVKKPVGTHDSPQDGGSVIFPVREHTYAIQSAPATPRRLAQAPLALASDLASTRVPRSPSQPNDLFLDPELCVPRVKSEADLHGGFQRGARGARQRRRKRRNSHQVTLAPH